MEKKKASKWFYVVFWNPSTNANVFEQNISNGKVFVRQSNENYEVLEVIGAHRFVVYMGIKYVMLFPTINRVYVWCRCMEAEDGQWTGGR